MVGGGNLTLIVRNLARRVALRSWPRLVVLTALAALCTGAPVAVASGGVWLLRFEDDFELGLNDAHWFIHEQNPPATRAFLASAGPDDQGADLGQSVAFVDTSGGGDAELIRRAFDPVTRLAIEWRERHDAIEDHLRLVVGGPGAPGGGGFAVATFGLGSDAAFVGKVVLATTDGGNDANLVAAEWTPGRWHTYRVEIDTTTFSFDFYFDGVLAASEVAFRQPMTAVVSYSFETGGIAASPTETRRWVDEVREFVLAERLAVLSVTPDTHHIGDECLSGFVPECPEGECLDVEFEVPDLLATSAQGFALIILHRESQANAGYANSVFVNGVFVGTLPDSAPPSLFREFRPGVRVEAVSPGSNLLSVCSGPVDDDLDDILLRDLRLKVCLTVSFTDVPCQHWAWWFIEAVAAEGTAAGFGDGTYRPEQQLTRAEIAVFSARAADRVLHDLASFTPPPCGQETFADVPCAFWAYHFIEYAVARGLISLPGKSFFRPNTEVTRAEMVEWTARVRGLSDGDLASFAPPPCGNETFADVSCSHGRYRFIEYAFAKGITAGFGGPVPTFRPEFLLNRGEMSVFVTRAARLPL